MKLMAVLMLAGGTLFAEPRVAIGVRIGAPAPVYVSSYRPLCPGPGYIWIDGYYDPYGNWFNGYWALPPYAGAYWVAPRYVERRFVAGYWGGARGGWHNDYRMENRGPVRHEEMRREPERHERGRDFGRGYRR